MDTLMIKLDQNEKKLVYQCNEGMELIKVMVIATFIMENTRKQPRKNKIKMKLWADYAISGSAIKKSKRDRYKSLDPLRVQNVTYLKFNAAGRKQLLDWYQETNEKLDDSDIVDDNSNN